MAEIRPTPVLEMGPEEKEKEKIIQFYLEAFLQYIVNCIDWKDLVLNYKHFTFEQRTMLQKIGSSRPESVTMECITLINGMTVPDRYTALVEAMKRAENSKVVDILNGYRIPGSEKHKDLYKFGKSICDQLKPVEILPVLQKKHIITDKEAEMIICKKDNFGNWAASFDLLFILPNRNVSWYKGFIEALLECNCRELAQVINRDLCDKIEHSRASGEELVSADFMSCRNFDNMQTERMKTGFQNCTTSKKPANKRTAADRLGEFGESRSSLSDVRENYVSDQWDPTNSVKNLNPADPRSMFSDDVSTSGSMDGSQTTDSINNLSSDKHKNEVNEHSSLDEQASLNFLSFVNDTDNFTRLAVMDENKSEELQELSLDSCNSCAETEGSCGDEYKSYQLLTRASSCSMNPEFPELPSVQNDLSNHPIESSVTDGCEGEPRIKIYRENSSSTAEKKMKDKDVMIGHDKDKTGNLNIIGKEPATLENEEEDEGEEVEDIDISLRHYQTELAGPTIEGKNVIIVAPTGPGKTRVALRIIQEHIRQQQGRGIAKVIFLVNQVALANQQGEACLRQLPKYTSKVISDESQRSPNEFLKDFIDKRDILIVTAQVLLDALIKKEISCINQFSLMIFDECHHTYANHIFNQIMGMYMELKFKKSDSPPVLPQIVGLTASVGVGKAKNVEEAMDHIKHLMANLDAQIICTVKAHMEELRSFVSLPDEETCTVPKRQNDLFGEGVTKLMNAIEQKMTRSSVVTEMPGAAQFEKVLKSPAQKGTTQYTQWVSKLWKETAKLKSHEARRFLNPCRAHLGYYNNALIIYNDARLEDAIQYLDGEMKKWKANAIMDDNEKKIHNQFEKLRKYRFDKCSVNPKLEKLRQMITKAYKGEKGENSRGIVFVKTRDLAMAIVSWMKETTGLRELNPIPFVGQNSRSDDKGVKMTKPEQDDPLKYFKDGKHKLIVATSVAEEGLDISKCNLVIRYDHVTNEIAMVQSRGRGRAQDSKNFVLATQGTGIAEKEELNMNLEVMMRKAILQLQDFIDTSPKKFKDDINRLQDEGNLECQLKSLGKKRRIVRTGEFELRCLKCSCYICMSSDVKKIVGAHHVVVDESLKQRVMFLESEPTDSNYGNQSMQFVGKVICNECGDSLGVVCIYRTLEFPVLKIAKFLIVDSNERQLTCKQWKSVPFNVAQLGTNDFREIQDKKKVSDLD